MNVLRMAWRNVWRNARRTGVTVAAMAFALFAMIVYSGLVEGYIHGLQRNIVDLEMGDVQVFAADYRADPSLHERIEQPKALVQRLQKEGFVASYRLLGSGLGAASDTSAGITLRGLDPDRDRRVSEVFEHVAEGQWLDPERPKQVVVGKRLARILGVELGDELVVLSQAADGSMANDLYTIRGVLAGVTDEVDRSGVFMLERAFRELMVVPEGAHQIVVRKPGDMLLPQAKRRVQALVADHEVATWRELAPTLASMLDSSRGAMYAMYLIVYVAIGMVILNAMLMAVFERIREFGVLKAIGVGPAGVLRLILTESALQTALAVGIGSLAAIPTLLYLRDYGIDLRGMGDLSIVGVAWDPIWRAVMEPTIFIGPITTLVAIVGLAVLYPGLRAAMIRPVEAMHHR